jgi:hypothetical protein
MNPKSDETRGKLIAHLMWSELEKLAALASEQTSAGEMQGPESAPGPQEIRPPTPDEEAPAHGIVGVKVEQLDQKKAKGIPVVQAPPGYVFAPELAAFKPNEADPGWMSEEQAMEAGRNKGWYDQGQHDTVAQQAQQKMDQQVQQQADMAVQDQQAQQQAQVQQASMNAEAQKAAVKESVKKQFKDAETAKAMPYGTPSDISGETAKKKAEGKARRAATRATTPKKSTKATGKGVTIQIGR